MKKTTLCLSGGSIRGICHVGALVRYNEAFPGFVSDIRCFVGTSIGALIGALLCSGNSVDDLRSIVSSVQTSDFLDDDFSGDRWGVFGGDHLEGWWRKHLPDETFQAMHDRTGKRLSVIATNLTDKEVCEFSHINTPSVPVLLALKASMAIPFVFGYEIIDNKICVDGGVLCNYPIRFCGEDLTGVLGVSIRNVYPPLPTDPSLTRYVIDVLNCLNVRADYGDDDAEHDRVVVPVFLENEYDVDIDEEKRKKLFSTGYAAMDGFIRSFSSV